MDVGSNSVSRRCSALGWLALVLACSSLVVSVPARRCLAQEALANRLPRAQPEQVGMQSKRLAGIDRLLDRAIAAGELPGAVVLIGHRGHIVFHQAYGHRQLLPEPVAMQTDTLFDLASLTKPIATATAIMQLLEQGRLRLRDPVAKHLPQFAAEGKEQVTIEQLLLHTSGLIADNPLSDYQGDNRAIRNNFLTLALTYPPGSQFRYSDVGFQVLGELVEVVSGRELAQYCRDEIFQPLGMLETGFLPPESLRRRAATTQQRDGRWMIGEVHDPRAWAMGGVAGHAGLFSTADDVAVYAQTLLKLGRHGATRILGPQTVRRMTAEHPVPSGIRGLGWDKQSGYSSNRGETMTPAAYGHGGFTGTSLWIDPDLDLMVIFLSNRVHPDGKGVVNPLAGAIGTVAASAVDSALLPSVVEQP